MGLRGIWRFDFVLSVLFRLKIVKLRILGGFGNGFEVTFQYFS